MGDFYFSVSLYSNLSVMNVFFVLNGGKTFSSPSCPGLIFNQ